MAVASDRISPAHVSALRHVKELRERRALAEWRAMAEKQRLAAAVEASANSALLAACEKRAATEYEIYSRLMSSERQVESRELERCRIVLEMLTAEVEQKREALDGTRSMREKADAEAAQSRATWVRSSAVMHKWELIETDLGKARDARQDLHAEIEAEDDIALRRAAGLPPQTASRKD